jgi:hypothetical protein
VTVVIKISIFSAIAKNKAAMVKKDKRLTISGTLDEYLKEKPIVTHHAYTVYV